MDVNSILTARFRATQMVEEASAAYWDSERREWHVTRMRESFANLMDAMGHAPDASTSDDARVTAYLRTSTAGEGR